MTMVITLEDKEEANLEVEDSATWAMTEGEDTKVPTVQDKMKVLRSMKELEEDKKCNYSQTTSDSVLEMRKAKSTSTKPNSTLLLNSSMKRLQQSILSRTS